MTWPYKSFETAEIIEEVRRHRNNLHAVTSADSMAALLKCLQGQSDLSGQIMTIDQMLRDRQEVETRILMDVSRERTLAYFLAVNPW
jgi:hypothetical protein